ncbi:rho GTPase-activating protein 23-like isoform X2 [Carcharodon carcharias]|uniref:rho GTPase-activating protein 23-like isoform X2 n=1 Tax=Carcharodon carcharias TaxID=13397 RepID=UPI001B7DD246|nr:rho GTPase-activating protein 23-like isoform X2 [Carcharodon carcharias]
MSSAGKAACSPGVIYKHWNWERPVGIDCSSPEPRCIWLAALRNVTSEVNPRKEKDSDISAVKRKHSFPVWEEEELLTKTQRDGKCPNENANMVQDEIFSWPGPKTVLLQKNSQGFGFTLRHFIVYPPESALHPSFKDEENGNGRGLQKSRTEPMDTIFVKSVKEGGAAYQAGLCTGDRIVKVNAESIIGKTYSQVISLIQNSEDVLELSVMPKDEDILQVAYSQDAYLKGNDPYSGSAQHIPEPPPICYPRHLAMTQTKEPLLTEPSRGRQVDNRIYNAGSVSDRGFYSDPSSPPDSVTTTSPPASIWSEGRARARSSDILAEIGAGHSSHLHHMEEIQYGMKPRSVVVRGMPVPSSSNATQGSSVPQGQTSSKYGSGSAAVQDRYEGHSKHIPFSSVSNHNIYSGPKSNIGQRSCISSEGNVKNDYFHSDVRTSWERLGSPKTIKQQYNLPSWRSAQLPRRSSSEDRCYSAMPPKYRSFSQDRLEETSLHKHWPHSASQDTLLAPMGESWSYRTRSEDYLGKCDRSLENLTCDAFTAAGDRLIRTHSRTGATTDGISRSGGQEQIFCQQYRPAGHSSGNPMMHGQKHSSQQNSGNINAYYNNSNSRVSIPPPQQCRNNSGHAQSVKRTDVVHVDQLSVSVSQNKISPLSDRSIFGSTLTAGAPKADRCTPYQVQRIDVPVVRDQRLTNHDRQGGLYPQQTDRKSDKGAVLQHEIRPVAVTKPGASQTSEYVSEIPLGFLQKEQETSQTNEAVILRQKPPTGRRVPHPLRHPAYLVAVDLPELPPANLLPADKSENVSLQQTNGKLVGSAGKSSEDSLASIPYIDEPTSPSIDLVAGHIPASAVVSSGQNPAPTIITSPASPTFTFPFTYSRHYSQDCSNIKASRRSSYLLAITTERSKSCDEGLNTYRDEGKVYSKLPKRVPSLKLLRNFFTDGSLDNLDVTENTRSKRHSTSELCDVTFSDVRKEGWLYFRQLVTEKGKRVVSSIRSWKRVYALLRSHSLYLYKDKRDAVTFVSSPCEDEQPICIKACLIDISYSETKRKNVFRLTTSDFYEYLFQAEDRDDMLNWIKIIQENSKTEGEDTSARLIEVKLKEYRNQSPANNKSDSSPKGSRHHAIRRPRSPRQDNANKDESSLPKDKSSWLNIMKKTKKTVSGAAFGVRLEECQPGVNNKFIPLIVEICCKLVEEKGLEYTGIYRVPGNNAMVSSLQEQLNKGMTDLNTSEEKWQDLNVISSLLKLFFRKLPEPLFTDDKYNDFIETNRLEDAAERLQRFKKLLRNLPENYFETLKFLTGHLKTVADHSEKNKMEPRNLALVFGPTLVRTSEDKMIDMVTHMQDRYKIIETLIQHYDWFFNEDRDMDEKAPIDHVGNTELQPVPNIDHLLSNIGRTGGAPGDISDSTTSDSAKSKGSWGSRKDLYNRELVMSIFAAANRKRKKQKEAKVLESSTDDDSEHEPIKAINKEGSVDKTGVDRQKDATGLRERQLANTRNTSVEQIRQPIANKEVQKVPGEPDNSKQNHTQTSQWESVDEATLNSSYRQQCSLSSTGIECSFKEGTSLKLLDLDRRINCADNQTAIASPQSHYNSEAFSRNPKLKMWRTPEMEHRETIPTDASSVVSGYSTISSTVTTLDHNFSSEVQSIAESRGDEADDERSELISECGGHIETDSESGYLTRTLPGKASHSQQERGRFCRRESDSNTSSDKEGIPAQKLNSRPSFNSHRLIQCDTLARKKLTKPKAEHELNTKINEDKEPPVVNLFDNLNDPNSSSKHNILKNDPDKEDATQTSKRALTDHTKLRLKTSADDMFGVGLRKQNSPETRRKKNIRRRHTVVVQNDLSEFHFRECKEKLLESKDIGHKAGKPSNTSQFGQNVDSRVGPDTGGNAQPDLDHKTKEICRPIDLESQNYSIHQSGNLQPEQPAPNSKHLSSNNNSERRQPTSLPSPSASSTSGQAKDSDSNSAKYSMNIKAQQPAPTSRFHQYL